MKETLLILFAAFCFLWGGILAAEGERLWTSYGRLAGLFRYAGALCMFTAGVTLVAFLAGVTLATGGGTP